MAKTKAIQPTLPTPPKPKPTAQEAMAALQLWLNNYEKERLVNHAKFVEGLEKSLIYTMEWRGMSVVFATQQAHLAAHVLDVINEPGRFTTVTQAFEYIEEWGKEDLNRIMDLREWDNRSTSPISNLVKLETVNATVKFWRETLQFIKRKDFQEEQEHGKPE